MQFYIFTWTCARIQISLKHWVILSSVQPCNFCFNVIKKDTKGGVILKAAVYDGGSEAGFATLILEASYDRRCTLRLFSVVDCCLSFHWGGDKNKWVINHWRENDSLFRLEGIVKNNTFKLAEDRECWWSQVAGNSRHLMWVWRAWWCLPFGRSLCLLLSSS